MEGSGRQSGRRTTRAEATHRQNAKTAPKSNRTNTTKKPLTSHEKTLPKKCTSAKEKAQTQKNCVDTIAHENHL